MSETKTYGERLDDLVRRYIEKNPEVPYRDAMIAVLETRPDLGREYSTEHKKKIRQPVEDPLEDHQYDQEIVKKKKARIRAGIKLDQAAKLHILLRGMTYDTAFKAAMLENPGLVKTYMGED